jgi:hypothetical protein
LSRLAQLGQAEFQCKVENKFLAGSNPAPAKKFDAGWRNLADANAKALKLSSSIYSKKLRKHGLNPSQIVNQNLSQLRCSNPVIPAKT